MEDQLIHFFDGAAINVVANILTLLTGLTAIMVGIYRSYVFFRHTRNVFNWRDINKSICKISKKITFTPDLIIGNSIISNILDENFPNCETIQLIEIDADIYESEKKIIHEDFIVAVSEMWIHLINKKELRLFLKKTPNPRIILFFNYISAGEVCKEIKKSLVTHLSEINEDFNDLNVYIATPFLSKEKNRKHARGRQLSVDYYWKEISSWHNIYLPWGHVSKSQRRGEHKEMGENYLCTKSKLWYKWKKMQFEKKPN